MKDTIARLFHQGGARSSTWLEPELRQRFHELKAEYRLMNDDGASAPLVIRELLAMPDHVATKADVFVLERGYAAALKDAFVAGAVQNWRSVYRGIVGDALYADYLATKPLDPSDADADHKIDRLRADLAWLIDRVHYLYLSVPAKDAIQNKISWRLAIVTLAALCIGAGYMAIELAQHPLAVDKINIYSALTVIIGVLFFGGLGGFVSALTRVQGDTGADPFFRKLELRESQWIVMLMSPLSGSIFALVLYLMLAGGILSGSVFPKFPPTEDATLALQGGLGSFFAAVRPAGGTAIALLMVWSFIAGFAERFVPDVLTRIASRDYFNSDKKA